MGMEISQKQLLGEGDYVTIEMQNQHDGHIMTLCHAKALNAWNSTEDGMKKIESFTKVYRS